MKNEQNNKELESLTKRIRFKSLPFDEKQMSDRLSDRVKRPVIISYTGKENSAWKYLSIAASIALLLVTGILLTDKEPEQELVYYETIAVPDAKTKITLPDSSIVWLNANACLRYPREFSEQVRQVEIKGEAFFEVRKDEKKPFMQTKTFLGIVTVFAALMLAFPKYAHIFYPSNDNKEVVIVNASDIQTVAFDVKGMTCNGCASHVENDVNKLPGIVKVDAIYEEATAKVEFDQTKVSLAQIEEAINGTGYKVVGKK